MKNRWKALMAKLKQNRVLAAIGKIFKNIWGVLSHNFGLKVLSLVIAVLLWNNVVANNASITRTKTIANLTGYISGQATLNSTYGLALLDNPADQLANVSVLVEVSQSEYAKVSKDNVQVTLDLSSVRTAGTQEVPLRATTSYGRVVHIMPDSLSLTFESMDARNIPVNVQLTGDSGTKLWYNVSRSNPSMLNISGAASVVQSIASAYVTIDVSGETSSFTVAERYVLMDSEGNEIPQTMLDRSSTSVSVSLDVYPTKEIPISEELENVITGQPAEGYVVESVSIQPDTLSVAAEKELLDSIAELHITPISVEGLTQSFAARASVAKLSSFKWISAEEVYVNVTIAEETVGVWVDDVKISYINKREGLTLDAPSDTTRVYVSGPRSVVESLQQNGFVATVDLAGLEAGDYVLGLSFPTTADPDVVFTSQTDEVRVTLTEDSAE